MARWQRLALALVAALALLGAVAVLGIVAIGLTTRDEPPEPPASRLDAPGGAVITGADVFLGAGCAGCHRLRLIGSTGSVGPDLDEHLAMHPHRLEEVVSLVTNGRDGMPAFRGRLSRRQIRSVAAFVLEATRATRTQRPQSRATEQASE